MGGRTDTDRLSPFNDWAGLAPVNRENFLEGRPLQSGGTVAYTDGSKNFDGVCGFGVVFRREGFKEVQTEDGCLGSRATVIQAEVYAIHRAAVHLDGLDDLNSVIIYSDSKRALASLCRVRTMSKTVENCREALRSLANHCSLELRWVKAHAGHSLNELADWMAKKGASESSSHYMGYPGQPSDRR